MLPILLSVAVISLSGVMMPGLMFGVTLVKSLKSPWAGTDISLGHAVVEIPVMLLIYFGFARFFENIVVQIVLSLFGGVMIIWLGIGMFRARRQIVHEGKDLPYNALITGIITSILNPFFWLWWATIGSMLVMKFHNFGAVGLILFMLVHWLCDLIWLTFISNLIYRTHSLWGIKFQESLFITGSLLLIGFGIWYTISGIQLLA
ncbi:MAG: LysE family transporter [Dehalococcoidales bacterium]|nr:LysE family transporter [Dehalococcoidales bacterium]